MAIKKYYDSDCNLGVLDGKTVAVIGFGLKGYHCENLAQFQEAFADALKQKGPTWIECMIDKDEKVLPMIPGGGDINDIIMK